MGSVDNSGGRRQIYIEENICTQEGRSNRMLEKITL
jgi:hypothetical protein